MRDPAIPMQAKAIYALLATYADDGARDCFPRQVTLAEQLGCSVDTLQRHLRVLEDAGLVTVTSRFRDDGSRSSNDYVLTDELTASNTAPVRHGPPTDAVSPHRMGAVAITGPVEQDQRTSTPSVIADDDATDGLLIAFPTEPPAEPDSFPEWYRLYPRKVGARAAEKAYRVALKRASAGELLDGLRRQLPHLLRSEMKYRPHPATWLNQGRWADDPTAVTGPASVPQGRGVNLAAHLLAQDMAAGGTLSSSTRPAIGGHQ